MSVDVRSTYAGGVNRFGMAAAAGALVAVPVLGAACGDDGLTDAPLPPIVTTTSTTISLITTTVVRQYYIVRSGDRLGNIADAFGVDMDELMALNGITNPNLIDVGDRLAIPSVTAPTILFETLPTG